MVAQLQRTSAGMAIMAAFFNVVYFILFLCGSDRYHTGQDREKRLSQ
jgi:hypothetical protein